MDKDNRSFETFKIGQGFTVLNMNSSCQNNKVVRAVVHKFACIKTTECNSVVSSSIGLRVHPGTL